MNKKIVLGSASPRRQQLLREVLGNIEVRTIDVDESWPSGLHEHQIAEYLAQKKAAALMEGSLPSNGQILITADTIVCLDDHVLNKPADRKEALDMLLRLSGRIHQVFTGVCIIGDTNETFHVRTDVQFDNPGEEILLRYIDQYKPFDKAGAYGAQECLPPNANPLSDEEKAFLAKIGKPHLFETSLAIKPDAHVPLIAKIEGSYFNVMGLPLVEVWERIKI